jgi:Protein of unknown function (DUF3006)
MIALASSAREGLPPPGNKTDQGVCTLKFRMSIDRFEGDKKQVAVLLADDGTQVTFPKNLLPKGAKAGDIIYLTIERDIGATRQVARETRVVQDDLKKTDSGGDIKL